MKRSIKQSFSVSFTYEVHFCRGLFHPDNRLFADLFRKEEGNRLLFVLDQGVKDGHPFLEEQIEDYCKHYPWLDKKGDVIRVPGGEAAKNSPDWTELLIREVELRQIDRHSYLVAIGGGAVLDMAGFAAAIAHRGVRHIRIPTTVLSQNDSGVGVKNGINFLGKKNFVGSFAPPIAVINDFDFLRSLDERDWRAGISEAIKVALIKDKPFFEWLEDHAAALADRDEPAMEYLIEQCARLHMEHIAGGDPFEMGSSRPLDFGHWSAHKVEQLSDFRIRHGEAVAIGIALDTVYSGLIGTLAPEDCQRVLHLFDQLGFPLSVPELHQRNPDGHLAIWQGLQEFREHLGGRLTIMLLRGLGQGFEVHEMKEKGIEKALQSLATFSASHSPVG
jgi:3-dehydroquinate synthase